MGVTILLVLSVLLQFAAAALAFRLIRFTGRKLAWGLISAAILLMAVRRSVSLYHHDAGVADVVFEAVGLMISAVMVIGLVSIRGLFDDLTRSGRALAEANQRLQTLSSEQALLLDNTRDFIYRHDSAGIFTWVSASVEKLTGHAPAEWLKHYTAYLTDHPLNAEARARTDRALATGEALPPYPIEILHRDGRRIWLEVNEKPLFADGKVAGVIGVARDVTERTHAEEERERLLRQLQEALAKIKTLSGLIPICAWCKKVRDDQGFWKQVEAYIAEHTEAHFTHGLCPDCYVEFTKPQSAARP